MNLIEADPKWCRTAINAANQTVDFKVCSVNREGADCCVKTIHQDMVGKKSVVRLDVADGVGIVVIVCLVYGTSVKYTSCFSRPLLRLSCYPQEILRLRWWEPLLDFRLRPATWRIILKEYEGAIGIYNAGLGKSPP